MIVCSGLSVALLHSNLTLQYVFIFWQHIDNWNGNVSLERVFWCIQMAVWLLKSILTHETAFLLLKQLSDSESILTLELLRYCSDYQKNSDLWNAIFFTLWRALWLTKWHSNCQNSIFFCAYKFLFFDSWNGSSTFGNLEVCFINSWAWKVKSFTI